MRWVADKPVKELLKKIDFRRILFYISCIVFVISIVKLSLKYYDYYQNRKLYNEIQSLYQVETPVNDSQGADNKDSEPIVNVNTELSEEMMDELRYWSIFERFDTNSKIAYQQNILAAKDEERKKPVPFDKLLKINKDTVGWIKINNSSISYPVVQSEDNDYYLHRNFQKKKSSVGAIFMDYRDEIKPLSKNIILYGHRMKDGSMFKDLILFNNRDFFKKNGKIMFNTLKQESMWQVFSVYITDTSFDYLITEFKSDEEYKKYLDTIKAKSRFKTDIDLTADDTILTLSTCSYEFENARTVVHAKLIKDDQKGAAKK